MQRDTCLHWVTSLALLQAVRLMRSLGLSLHLADVFVFRQVWNLLFSQGKYAQQQGLALNLTALGPRSAPHSATHRLPPACAARIDP